MSNESLKDQLTQAQIRRENAAAAKAEAELAKVAAEVAGEHLNNQRLADEFSREAEISAYNDARDGFDFGLFRIAEAVSGVSVGQLLKELQAYSLLHSDQPFSVEYCSPGGSVLHGLALFDYIRKLSAQGHEVTTVISGYSASMAGVLIQAGDRRVIGRQSYLHLHEVSSGAIGKTFEIVDEAAFAVRLTRQLLNLYVERSPKKGEKVLPAPWGGEGHVELTTDNLVAWVTRYERWLNAEEALALGFVDEIQ